MKNTALLLWSLLLFSCGSTKKYQSNNTPTSPYKNTATYYEGKYTTFLNEGEIEQRSWFHYMVSVDGNGTYVVRTFYPETRTMTAQISYRSKMTLVKNGPAMEWYDDGSKVYEGTYLAGKRHGVWKRYYYGTDILSDSGRYENDQKQGNWQEYDNKGRLEAKYAYVNGERDGDFFQFDSLGTIVNKGVYRSDTIFAEDNPTTFAFDEVNPSFSNCNESEDIKTEDCGHLKMAYYIRDNFEYPKFARENYVQGTALVQFVIEKDGSVTDVKAIRGLCDAVKVECERIIKKMPKWEQPGMQAGEPVRVRYTIPIKLRLA
ncbi:MAG: energy transducer TonB [Putridiphycobacter sp.]|nr:energy transducer TonB [Putridiphycobacter sp.]